MPPQRHPPLSILCFGASLVEGYTSSGATYSPYSITLSQLLKERFPGRQITVETDGKSGDLVTGGFAGRMRDGCKSTLLFSMTKSPSFFSLSSHARKLQEESKRASNLVFPWPLQAFCHVGELYQKNPAFVSLPHLSTLRRARSSYLFRFRLCWCCFGCLSPPFALFFSDGPSLFSYFLFFLLLLFALSLSLYDPALEAPAF
jgi:hypothetical protein